MFAIFLQTFAVIGYNQCDAIAVKIPSKSGEKVATIGLFLVEPSIAPFSYRDYRGIQPEALMGALAGCDWSDFHGDTFELHTALDCLNTNLTAVIDSLAPLKVVHNLQCF